MKQILIKDDSQLICDAWTTILNSDRRFRVIGSCSDSTAIINSFQRLQPDVLLFVIHTMSFNELEIFKIIRKISPATAIVVVNMSSHPENARQMLKLGALGYLTKKSTIAEMKEAILAVSKGNKYNLPEISEMLPASSVISNNNSAIHSLTKRELEIIIQIKAGYSSREISTNLNISLKTVQVHRHNIFKKLQVKNAVSLIQLIDERSVRT